jgi:tetratricopeptide (TPR) repeat protein
LVYAGKAVRLLMKTLSKVDEMDRSKTTSGNFSSTKATNDYNKDFIILGIAYYNMGTEYEYIKDYSKAMNAYDKGLEALNNKVSSDNFIYQNLVNASRNIKEKHRLLLNYHNDCARARSLGSPRLLYMGTQEIDKRDIMVSNSIKEEKYDQLSASLLPIEETISSV